MLKITRPDTFRPSTAPCASAIDSSGNLASISTSSPPARTPRPRRSPLPPTSSSHPRPPPRSKRPVLRRQTSSSPWLGARGGEERICREVHALRDHPPEQHRRRWLGLSPKVSRVSSQTSSFHLLTENVVQAICRDLLADAPQDRYAYANFRLHP